MLVGQSVDRYKYEMTNMTSGSRKNLFWKPKEISTLCLSWYLLHNVSTQLFTQNVKTGYLLEKIFYPVFSTLIHPTLP